MEKQQNQQQIWLDRPVFGAFPQFSREKLIIALIILLALLSRFVGVGDRVMSHDEVNHVVPAYNFYQGTGYAHDPITHGPFQFHMLALSYFLFGDSDLSSRIPAALFSVAAVIFVLFAFRRYLGRIGTLAAGVLFLISPYILFYGRYTRNEAFIELFAVLTFYAFLRYYEKRDHFSLYLLAVVTALQFTTKEVAYIYSAQLLLFCGFLFLKDLWNMGWASRQQQSNSAMLVLFTLLLFVAAMFFYLKASGSSVEGTAMTLPLPMLVCGALGVFCLIFTIVYIVKALGWKEIRTSVSFNLIAFLGTLILPQLTAFPVKLIGWEPLDYSSAGILRTGIVLVLMFLISFVLGCLWDRPVFLKSAATFYLIFVFFYTTVFSNGQGFFTGIIGSLGYWLSQQGVQRGGQPGYYYWLIQVPLYEYGALLGAVLALVIAIKRRMFWTKPGDFLTEPDEVISLSERSAETEDEGTEEDEIVLEFVSLDENGNEIAEETDEELPVETLFKEEKAPVEKVPTLLFFLYWSLSSIIAYSLAGEKMPWLTVHIAMPIALSAAWGFGCLLEQAPWKKIRSENGLVSVLLLVVVLTSLCGMLGAMLSPLPPFSGKTTEELKSTYRFALSLICLVLSAVLLSRKWKNWHSDERGKLILICFFVPLLVLQARTAFTAAFINYDYANELLVYAHAAPGPKVALNMIEEIAARTGEGKSIKVAYDNDCLYPYWWYFRDYTNKNYFGDGNPTRELRNYDIIVLNSSKEGRMEPIVKNDYYKYNYTRLWWPNQDYFGLSFGKVVSNLLNPKMRSALFHIWLDRDYSKYAAVTNKTTLTPETWEPSARLSLYIKKDLMQRMWLLSDQTLLTADISGETEDDEDRFTALDPVIAFGAKGNEEGQFAGPRGVALSPDGKRVYVLDSDNNRVQYFTRTGQFEGQWDALEVNGMNQPWGIAVDSEGNVYVADTWNHRLLKFTSEGKFIDQWFAGDPEEPERGFYGPRSIAISSDGKVFVSDTGNKRVMVYDQKGTFLYKFGISGMGMGELDEPVGLSLVNDTTLAVADTWNQRVQVFDVSDAVKGSMVLNTFEVAAWYSQSLNNKPYLAAAEDGTVYLTDPEGYLILQYGADGKLVRTWNGAGGDIDRFSMPTGITLDPTDSSLWVTDAENCTINHFVLSELPSEVDADKIVSDSAALGGNEEEAEKASAE